MATSFNTTVQQFSPTIVFDRSWSPGTREDTKFGSYLDGFELATAEGAMMTFQFTGTGVWLYGALRGNHGNFEAILDGQSQVFNGASPDNFQTIMYRAFNLENKDHTLQLINRPQPNRPFVDVDFITFESQVTDASALQYFEANDTRWKNGGGWTVLGDTNAQNSDLLASTTSGATISLEFEGDNIQLFGTVGRDFGSFNAVVDNMAPTYRDVDCSSTDDRDNVLLYSAMSLGAGKHVLTLEKQGGGRVEVDYALLRAKPNTRLPSGSKPNVGAIVGGVIGGLVFLGLIAFGLFFWYRRRRGTREITPKAEIDEYYSAPSAALPQPFMLDRKGNTIRRDGFSRNTSAVSSVQGTSQGAPSEVPGRSTTITSPSEAGMSDRSYPREKVSPAVQSSPVNTLPSPDSGTQPGSYQNGGGGGGGGGGGYLSPTTPGMRLPPPNYWQVMDGQRDGQRF